MLIGRRVPCLDALLIAFFFFFERCGNSIIISGKLCHRWCCQKRNKLFFVNVRVDHGMLRMQFE